MSSDAAAFVQIESAGKKDRWKENEAASKREKNAQNETFPILLFDEDNESDFRMAMKISENLEKAKKRIEKTTDGWYYSKYRELAE